MALYLNTNKNLENYKELYRSKYFIDKSLIIDNLNLILKLRKTMLYGIY